MNNYLIVDNIKIPIKTAISQEEQANGLMFVKHEPPIMAFIYSSPKVNKFWMKNTFVPLDIAFIKNNQIIHIGNGIPHSTMLVGPDEESDIVLEFPKGKMRELGLKLGDFIKLEFDTKTILKIIK